MMRHDSVANLLRGSNDSDDEFVEITVKRVNATGNAVIQMEGNLIGGVLEASVLESELILAQNTFLLYYLNIRLVHYMYSFFQCFLIRFRFRLSS